MASYYFETCMQIEKEKIKKGCKNEREYKDIFEGKPKIFSISLCDEKVELWNNKFINISKDEDSHEKSIRMMKEDGIIDQ